MKKNILLVSTILVGAGLLANVSLGDVAPLNAAGSKRRISATVNTATKIGFQRSRELVLVLLNHSDHGLKLGLAPRHWPGDPRLKR
jgi:hypothetical protein